MDQLQLTYRNIAETEFAIRDCKDNQSKESSPVHYRRLMKAPAYYFVLVALIAVDFVSNMPVFKELLPGTEPEWRVNVLALGVVSFLIVLGHFCGKSFRKLIAFNRVEDPSVKLGLRSHRRQAIYPCIASALGIILVIVFLYISRSRLEPSAHNRFIESQNQAHQLNNELSEARVKQDDVAIESLGDQLEDARKTEQARSQKDVYAYAIYDMNFPLSLLNIALALVAIFAAYLHDKDYIQETRLEDPRMAVLEPKLSGLREEALRQRQQLRSLDLEVQTRIAQVQYLSNSFPLRDSIGKVRRLEGIVPSYRAENARLRGIDVVSISAFHLYTPLELPEIDKDESFPVPNELATAQNEFERLRVQLKVLYGAASNPAKFEGHV